MSLAIVAGVSVGASLLATGYSIYSQEQAQKRANQVASDAAAQTAQAQALQDAKNTETQQQQAQLALRNQQQALSAYDRSGTILASDTLGSTGGSGMGTQGGGKTLLGQ